MDDSTDEQKPNDNDFPIAVKDQTDINLDDVDLGRAVATVFLKHTIISEVVDETLELCADVDDFKRWLNSFDRVQLRFADVDTDNIRYHRFQPFSRPGVVVARALGGIAVGDSSENIHIIDTLFHAAIPSECGSFLECPLHFNDPIPLSKMRNGILVISNHITGVFTKYSALKSKVSAKRNNDNKTHFELQLIPHTASDDSKPSKYILVGSIDLLSETDRACLEEEGSELIQRYLRSGEGLESPNAKFVPRMLKLLQTPVTKYQHSLVMRAFLSKNCAHSANNDFHCAIVKTIGSNEDMSLLEKNTVLKDRMNAFEDIIKLMDTVQINHDDKTTKLNLSDGQLVPNYMSLDHSSLMFRDVNYPAWVIYLPDGIAFSERYSLRLRVSGVKFGAAGKHWGESQPILNGVNGLDSQGSFYTKYDPYAKISCSVHRGNDTEEEHFVVTEIAFRLSGIKETLDALGIDVEL